MRVEVKLRRVLWMSVVAIVVALLAAPSVGYGNETTFTSPTMLGSSSTNPNPPSGDPSFWRQGWGNSVNPNLTVSTSGWGRTVDGMYYFVDRLQYHPVDFATTDAYQHAVFGPGGFHFSGTLDLLGVFAYPPSGGWTYSIPGMTQPYEGEWFMHLEAYGYDANGHFAHSVDTSPVAIFVDVTPPTAVASVTVTPNDGSIVPSETAVGSGTRATVYWKGADYDLLSGTAFYRVYVDGQLAFNGATTPTMPDLFHENIVTKDFRQTVATETHGPAPIWYNPDWTRSYKVTAEDLAPGRHTLQVSAVDRAENEGAKSAAAVFYSDPDTPTVSITSPTGSHVGRIGVFSADATDAGGMRDVTFLIDGEPIGTDSSAPYSLTKDMLSYPDKSYTLTVQARDMFGRIASRSKEIIVDKVVPVASSFRHGPSPFFPVKRDRYKDYSTISFSLNRSAYVALSITNSSGTVVRTYSKSGVAGANSFRWDGKWSDGKVRTGRFGYQLRVYDGYGGSTYTTKLTTTIRNYEIVKIGRNRVKIVPR
ncbi:MAG: Ig-like domain-containing protein [Coriobacteriia bacterium]|nr:Ig-like domain-containing protein [Coriobacteriia bacterium]